MRELVGGVIETREETDASLNAEREAGRCSQRVRRGGCEAGLG